jgi:4-hydroxyphenylpyruvate dioxygenase-like putative hemolysin
VQSKIPLHNDEVEFLVKMSNNDLLSDKDARNLLQIITHTFFTNLAFAKLVLPAIIELIEKHRKSMLI